MKKIGLFVIVFLFISSVAFASPLMDYSAGQGSIDLNWRDTQNTVSGGDIPDTLNPNQRYNFDGTLTFGLG